MSNGIGTIPTRLDVLIDPETLERVSYNRDLHGSDWIDHTSTEQIAELIEALIYAAEDLQTQLQHRNGRP